MVDWERRKRLLKLRQETPFVHGGTRAFDIRARWMGSVRRVVHPSSKNRTIAHDFDSADGLLATLFYQGRMARGLR